MISRILSIAIFSVLLSQVCHAEWREFHEESNETSFLTSEKRRRQGKPEFLVNMPSGSLIYADVGSNIMRLRRNDGTTVEYRDRLLNPSVRREWKRIKKDKEKRSGFYRSEPVVETITNIHPMMDTFIVIHYLTSKYDWIRIVQTIDEDLKVLRSWEDVLVLEKIEGSKEPLSISEGGLIATKGEKGEVLIYTIDGKIAKRFVIPGNWNSARKIKAAEFDKEKHSYMPKDGVDAIIQTREYTSKKLQAKLDEREPLLPSPSVLSGDSMPEGIKRIVFVSEDLLLIMDTQGKIYEIDMKDYRIEPKEIGDIGKRNYGGAQEKIYEIRYICGHLFILTSFRIIQVDPKKEYAVIRDHSVPPSMSKQGWDVGCLQQTDEQQQTTIVNPFALYVDRNSRGVETMELTPY